MFLYEQLECALTKARITIEVNITKMHEMRKYKPLL